MSVENLKEYARRCAADPELRAVAKDIGLGDVDEHMRHAGSMGLDWDRGDLVEFRKELGDGEDFEDLSEEELEQIAAGFATATALAVVGAAAGVAAGIAVGGIAAGVGVGAAAAAGRGGW